MKTSNNKKVIIIGGNLRNKGAWLMSDVVITKLTKELDVFFFTPFPEDVKVFKEYYSEYSIQDVIVWEPYNILLSFIKLPFKKFFNDPVSIAFKESQLVVDISGVVFVQKRGIKYLIYNSLITLIPYFYGLKIIKLPQSFGPITTNWYKIIARYVLRKCLIIFSRGPLSYKTLKEIGIDSVESTDITFLKETSNKIISYQDKKIAVISPSVILEKEFEKTSIDYVEILEDIINYLLSCGYLIQIFPNSVSKNYKNNFDDLSICKKLNKKFVENSSVKSFLSDLNPLEIEGIIKNADILVTSRYHSMILGLNNCVVPIVMGWNQKYLEILSQFKLENNYISRFENKNNLMSKVHDIVKNQTQDKKNIENLLKLQKKRVAKLEVELKKFI
jgi:polysaccharide pyruvyl transferase WcaK-like protein